MARTPEQIRKDYDARVRDLRARRDLSQEGLQRQLAKALTEARGEMQRVKQSRADALAAQRDTLLLRLFENPTGRSAHDAISMRDASDRAAQAKTVAEARELMERARVAGDAALVQAVAMHAATKNNGTRVTAEWGEIVGEWAQASGRKAVYDELTEVERSQRPASMFEFHLQRPSEVPTGRENALAIGADDLQPEQTPGDKFAASMGWGSGNSTGTVGDGDF